jgi:ATP-dependent Clp protease ATP-binding subunit ClpA
MTSNIGTEEFARSAIGFQAGAKKASDEERQRDAVMEALKKFFKPEFLNRIDDFIVFDQLTEEDLAQIVELMVDKVRERLADRSIGIELTAEAKAWLVEEGYDPIYGARPLRRAVERYIENEIAKRMLGGELVEGDTIEVGAADGSLTFTKVAPAERQADVA